MKHLLALFALAFVACAPKLIPNAQCPADAICEAIDFGDYTITGCFSRSEAAKLHNMAATRRAQLSK